MKEILSTILAVLILFGGLIMWPWMRKVLGVDDRRVKWLKTLFFTHIVLLVASFALVYYSYLTSPDWLHSLILPYFIGALSLIVSFILLVAGKSGRRDANS